MPANISITINKYIAVNTWEIKGIRIKVNINAFGASGDRGKYRKNKNHIKQVADQLYDNFIKGLRCYEINFVAHKDLKNTLVYSIRKNIAKPAKYTI